MGNRLLSAANAIVYAKATDREWCIDWTDGLYAGAGVNAANLLFDGLDEYLADFKKLETKTVNPSLWSGRIANSIHSVIEADYPGKQGDQLLYRTLSADLNATAKPKEVEVFWSFTSKFGRIYRFLNKDLKRKGREAVLGDTLRNYFPPKPNVVRQVNALLGEAPVDTLGVHVRYTDLKVPLDKVINEVARQIAKHGYKQIYLATDSQLVEDLFKDTFSAQTLITTPKNYNENNVRLHGAGNDQDRLLHGESALVDMFSLARCNGLVYCSRSTFAEVSRLVGNFDKNKAVDVDRYYPPMLLKRILREFV